MSFTVRFLQLRKQHSLTQQQMAEAVGIHISSRAVVWMSFTVRFLQLRKQHSLTQQQMAEAVGIHITQVKRYEAGEAQPSLELLKRIALAFNVTTDWLIFEQDEREPQDGLKLKFEAVAQMDAEERAAVDSLLDAMILKQQNKRFFVTVTDKHEQTAH